MPEWTLCASKPVYARPGIDTKPRSPQPGAGCVDGPQKRTKRQLSRVFLARTYPDGDDQRLRPVRRPMIPKIIGMSIQPGQK